MAKNDMEIDQQVKILCNNLKRLREENDEVREECKREKKKVRAIEESKAFLESGIKTLREAAQINKKDGTSAMYKAQHRERYKQIRWLLDKIKKGVSKAERMRDRAREVRPRVSPLVRQQPMADFLDDAIDQYGQIISYFDKFMGWPQ
ncbi:hypothetical protein COLO4_20125 [Corchorus olitorius]|uniref:Uncharacterized protein n=1 Tax=Corchorus olitorius TaxID=93759 RepID=A0A1R3J1H4_9ROSI|nr:hypothetical protein COLO4_20125 [Corchorus olitorius]